MKKYDVAAYIWPSYTGKEPRARQFWEQGIGEWQSVLSAEARVEGQILPRKPLWGTVDEADPEVMAFQIKEALRHGVNVFIYDWYWYDRRPFLEQCLDEVSAAARNLSVALEQYEAVREAIRMLDEYLGSRQWKQDCKADEAGKLPKDLKRGVLSEDGIWNVLEECRQADIRMQEMAAERKG